MTPTDELAEIRDRLKEARRYVRTNVPVARRELGECRDWIFHWMMGNQTWHLTAMRLRENLAIGLEYIQVNPDVTIGYIDGAIFELGLKGE